MSQILQWHPAFQAAMQIELSEEMDKLEAKRAEGERRAG